MASRFERGQTAAYGLDALQSHVAMLNAYNWVKASGRLYFIAVRESDDGRKHYYIDRQA